MSLRDQIRKEAVKAERKYTRRPSTRQQGERKGLIDGVDSPYQWVDERELIKPRRKK